ncbi:MbeB family mobilization protein [Enterobacter intestinihominis]
MSSLLTLAKDLEQQSKAQQQSTGALAQTRIPPALAECKWASERIR